LFCHCSWHVENIEEICCYFWSEVRVIHQPYTTP
jgi:hypothetical protein